MFVRRAAVVLLVAVVVVLGASPASAASRSDDFRIWSRVQCTATDEAGDPWRVVVTPLTDTGKRLAWVEYSLLGPDGRRGSIQMPIGWGAISVVDVDLDTGLDGPGGEQVQASRRSPWWLVRHECRYVDSGAPPGTFGIGYLVPPRKPTVEQVVAYCADFVREHGEDDWESQRCESSLLARIGAPPPA